MKQLTDAALAAETLRLRGPMTSANLFGWLFLAGLAGVQNRDQLGHVEWGPSRSTRWRLVRDVNALRDDLAQLGYDVTPDQLTDRMMAGRRAIVA